MALLFAGSAWAQVPGVISGTVTDESGAAIYGAVVTIEGSDGAKHTTVTDANGAFQVASLGDGTYSIKFAASGLTELTLNEVRAGAAPVTAALKVAPSVTTVNVGLPPEELAREQVKQEEKQRAFGVIPNYFVSYEKHPAPLNWKQKLDLGFKTTIDWTTFAASGLSAGIQQARNSYFEYGQGSEGFAKRFGANYATSAIAVMAGGVLMDSLLHQDPRYVFGDGTRAQRFRYALKASFLTRGDNGKWQFPWSDMAGLVVSAELSETYLPGSRTQYTLLGRSFMFRFVGRVGLNMVEEFFLKGKTSNAPVDKLAQGQPLLREGTPVSLIAVDGLTAEGAERGKTVNFVLAQDLTADGKVVAKTGSVASGQMGQVRAGKTDAEAGNIGLEQVQLQAGSLKVPLRSNQVRGTGGAMQYKELPDSKKVEVTLYVAESVRVPQAQ